MNLFARKSTKKKQKRNDFEAPCCKNKYQKNPAALKMLPDTKVYLRIDINIRDFASNTDFHQMQTEE